ncbi:uncharacterized protein LOC118192895 [Stegodyphus dumicola]|uniref:uncharacterized protein LOC118192895 n=1 Tax=Stegodyphus dumicola TaxID=202533 RepID=UPI0015AA4C3B|nr:uncharacterized protein LOC118192895 [Stegodyphus dumicola]
MRVNQGKTTCQFFSLNRQHFTPRLMHEKSVLQQTDGATYLGYIFDKRLTWRKHAEHVVARAEGRLPILKHLAGVKWGCGTETLNSTYKIYIRPILNYCCEILISATRDVIHLEVFQNQALRIITSTVKMTPIPAMQLLLANQPVTNLIQKNAFILFQRLICLPSNPHWRNYDYNKQRNLKTQNGFLQCVFHLEQYNHIRTLKPALLFLLNPLDYSFLDVQLNLEMKVDKKEMSPEQIRTIALETIEQCFPAEEWIHVYMDGSLPDRIQEARAGVFSKLFSFYIPVGM